MTSKSIDIVLPYNFNLRHYQYPLFQAFFIRGIKKFCIVWHRRAGKDKTCLNLMIAAAALKKGMYIYVFPQLAQARRVIWNGIDSDGNRFLDHFPSSLIKSINNINMSIQLTNGSMFQLLGSDRYDRLRGLNFEGVILSEAQQHHPEAWNVLEPIHKENKNSWVLFEGTPNGRDNFLYESYAYGKTRDDWYTDLRTVDHTFREDGNWVISPEDIDELRQKGTLEAIIQQEYYCSFNAPNIGSYYGDLMEKAENENRILDFEIDLSLPVYTAWDLGMRDSTAIWLFQFLNGQIRLIYYYENTGNGIKH